VLVKSPLLKRLRHFSLAGTPYYQPTLARLAEALDANRIESFLLRLPNIDLGGAAGTEPLRAKFGDKFRILPA
jgi:hypothetical protein